MMRSLPRLTPRAVSGVAFLLMLVAWAAPARAQEGAIAGTVTDAETGVDLSTVRVQVVDETGTVVAEALTSATGTFRIGRLPAGTYAVVFSSTGWETTRETGVVVRSGRLTEVQVSLAARAFNLNPITVTTSKRVEKLLDAPAAVSVVSSRDIRERPALTTMDHVKNVASVDMIKSGLQQGYVVTRGFNNVFSGSLLMLTDNRIARVPSLRANITHLDPTTNLDIDRIEVVRGPGSALYGPNAANGVLHVITKSPIDDPGSAISVAGGIREQDGSASPGAPVPAISSSEEGVGHFEGRLAHKFSDQFGVQLSGKYFAGEDYRFFDPAEEENRVVADACLQAIANLPPQQAALEAPCQLLAPAAGQLPDTDRLDKIASRDFDLREWTLNADAEWRPSQGVDVHLSYGRTQANSSIDLTGIGAAQVDDWSYQYAQARVDAGDLFVQGFVNWSNAGDTYILRTGQPIDDESVLAVGQIQHASSLGENQRFVYGVDVLRTDPRTNGSINGIHEADDQIWETGGYVQSETRLSSQWDLVLAARADYHSILDEAIFSPRAALVFEPADGHKIRGTYNRAFSTPDNNNLFLDIQAQRVPITGPFSYGLRAQGTTDRGFSFRMDQGGRSMMKSPFTPVLQDPNITPATFLPTRTPTLWGLAAGLVVAENPALAPIFASITPPTEDQVATVLGVLNTGEDAEENPFLPFDGGFSDLDQLPAIQEQITNTWELGYKGLIGERLLLSGDAYFSLVEDFIGPLRIETPNAFLNGNELGLFLTPQLVGAGVPVSQAAEIVQTMASIPLGVVQPQEVSSGTPTMLLTYRNFGNVEVFGADLSAQLQITDQWSWDLATSVVSDETFQAGGTTVNLNAPSFKIKTGVGYRHEETGFNSQLDFRHIDSFPANSGVFVGQVDSYDLFDVTLGYELPGTSGVRLQLDVQNLFDERHRTFPGTPTIGRFTMARLVWEFGG